MRIPILKTEKYKNCHVEIDKKNETLILFGPKDNKIGNLTLQEILDYLTGAISINKRRAPRTPLSLRIRYTNPEGKWYESITDTIGGGGLFIETRTPFHPGTPVTVEMSLPGKKDKPIQAEGVVAWTRKKFERILYFPGMGIQFTKVSKDDQRFLISEINLLNSLRGLQEGTDQKE
ncbi:MAG TPA: TIGR02266 family protein [Nitrospiria bacterium]|jgi:uncharacterized protein (TIGR02266 family)